jgi:two-component system OmpR family response regulator
MSKPRRVMVIDDSEVMLARIKRVLVAAGYDVIASTHPVGNARHLPTCDLVILDFHMPGLDGSSVVASLRALVNSLKNECQLFVYSSDKKIESDYARLGFDGAITSKGDEQALVRQVAAVFRRLDIKAALREKQRA